MKIMTPAKRRAAIKRAQAALKVLLAAAKPLHDDYARLDRIAEGEKGTEDERFEAIDAQDKIDRFWDQCTKLRNFIPSDITWS